MVAVDMITMQEILVTGQLRWQANKAKIIFRYMQ